MKTVSTIEREQMMADFARKVHCGAQGLSLSQAVVQDGAPIPNRQVGAHNSKNYGLLSIYHDISILTMIYKPTNITGGGTTV